MLSILFELFYGLAALLILYFLNKLFNYKAKLIKLMVTEDAYRASIIIIFVLITMIYGLITDKSISSSSIAFSMWICFLYLIKLPENQG